MTFLLSGKCVKRVTASRHRGRPITVELHPEILVFRLKGMKTRFSLSIVGAFEQAMRVEALAQIRKRKAERESRKKARKEGLL